MFNSILKLKTKVIGLVGGVIFLASSVVFAFSPYVNGEGEYPEFDLPPLTKSERWEKINQFIKPYEFELYTGTALKTNLTEAEQKDCEDRLIAMKSVTEDDILEPEFVSQSTDDRRIKNLLQQCDSYFEPYKQYYPNEQAWNDKAHQHHSYSHYYLADSNMEFYNFSSIVGEGHWGLLSEGGRPYCKRSNNDLCTNTYGYSAFGKTISAKSCKNYVLDVVTSRKTSHSQKIDGKRVVNHYKNNNFFFFAEVNNSGYLVTYKAAIPPKKACSHFSDRCPNFRKDDFIRISRIPRTKDFDIPFLQCNYRLKPSTQGE